jgi:hypothetical protein
VESLSCFYNVPTKTGYLAGMTSTSLFTGDTLYQLCVKQSAPQNVVLVCHKVYHAQMHDDPELVQILEIFIYSENTGILPIERTTIRMVNYNQ